MLFRSRPTTTQNVRGTVSGSTDPEGDLIIYEFRWFRRNGTTWELIRTRRTQGTYDTLSSTLTTKGAPTTLEALKAGAFEVVEKPTSGVRDHLQAQGQHLIGVVKAAAGANVRALARKVVAAAGPTASASGAAAAARDSAARSSCRTSKPERATSFAPPSWAIPTPCWKSPRRTIAATA